MSAGPSEVVGLNSTGPASSSFWGFESVAGLVNDVAHFSHSRMFGGEGLLVWDEADESKFLLSHIYEAML